MSASSAAIDTATNEAMDFGARAHALASDRSKPLVARLRSAIILMGLTHYAADPDMAHSMAWPFIHELLSEASESMP